MAIHKFTRLMKIINRIPFYGDGSTARDLYIYRRYNRWYIRCMNAEDQFAIYNLGNSEPVKLDELVHVIGERLGCEPIFDRHPLPAGDVIQTFADVSRAKSRLDYEPQVSIDDGISQFIEWFDKMVTSHENCFHERKTIRNTWHTCGGSIATSFYQFTGLHPNEDPGISPNVRVGNPMGILGVWLAYFFIKLTFGYSSFILPLLAISWEFWFFTHKEFEAISRLSGYLMGVVVLSSISLGAAQIFRYGFDDTTFRFSGLIGGLISLFIYDFVGGIGIVIVLLTLWLVLARGYFGFSYYAPIKIFLDRIQKRRTSVTLLQTNNRLKMKSGVILKV